MSLIYTVDFSCKFSKLQYNSLAFVAGFKRATDEGSLPKIVQYSPYYLSLNVFTASKGSNLYILLYIAVQDGIILLWQQFNVIVRILELLIAEIQVIL